MDVVDKISSIPTGPAGPFPRSVPQVPVVIKSVALVKARPKSDATSGSAQTQHGG